MTKKEGAFRDALAEYARLHKARLEAMRVASRMFDTLLATCEAETRATTEAERAEYAALQNDSEQANASALASYTRVHKCGRTCGMGWGEAEQAIHYYTEAEQGAL